MSQTTHTRIAILSAIYLIFEFGFNLKLLETAGGVASRDTLHYVEIFGRVLSGFGLGIIALKYCLPKMDLSASGVRAKILGVFAISIGFMYGLQLLIINRISMDYDATDRQRATSLIFTAKSSAAGHTIILGVEQLDRSESLVFHALLPFMQDGTTAAESTSINRLAVGKKLEETLQMATDSQRLEFYKAYSEGLRQIRETFIQYEQAMDDFEERMIAESEKAYQDYLSALRAFRERQDELPAEQQVAWLDYQQELRKRNLSLPIGAFQCQFARQEVKKKLPAISPNWDCNSRAAFNDAVAVEFQKQMEREWNRQSSAKLGSVIPRNLSRTEFFKNPNVQVRKNDAIAKANEAWNDEMLKKTGLYLPRGLSYKEFVGYRMIVESIEKQSPEAMRIFRLAGYSGYPIDISSATDFRVKILDQALKNAAKTKEFEELTVWAGLAAVETYGKDGINRDVGYKSVQALVGPPIALAFSLFFFLLNSLSLITGFMSRKAAIIVQPILIVSVMFLPLLKPNELTTWNLYKTRLENVETHHGSYAANAINWLAHMQPIAHKPFSNMLDSRLSFAPPAKS